MSSFIDESLLTDFISESRDHLQTIEPDLLAMEREGTRVEPERVNRIFRAIHSIKGGAGFLAFDSLKRLSHVMESVLMQLRESKLQVSPELLDALFAGVDKLRAMLDDLSASDSMPCQEEIARLESILDAEGVAMGRVVRAAAVSGEGGEDAGLGMTGTACRNFELDEVAVEAALKRGMHLYCATLYMHRDLKNRNLTPLKFLEQVESVGTCLEGCLEIAPITDLDNCLEQDFAFVFLFASVLEHDLAVLALELPPEQINTLDSDAMRKRVTAKRAPQASEMPDETPAESSAQEAAPETSERPASCGAGAPPERRTVQEGGETLRVKVDLLNNLMNLAGELVLGRNQLLRTLGTLTGDVPSLAGVLQNINQVTTELQEGIMQTRMQPVGTLFNRFPRIVRDMARSLGKEIEVEIEGAEVELDKSIVELLADPLTHIIRNCVDHAIEPPDERTRRGKPRSGCVRLHAYHEAGQVNIAISDDGRGIDADNVKKKALERGVILPAQAASMTERELVNLIFAPGFSTASVVTDVSGRGVGMDVVRTNTERLGGNVQVETQVGMGTTILLRLPLTLAIIPSMVVGVSRQRFAIPQVNVVEFVWVKASDATRRISHVQGAPVLRLRGRLLPLVRLADVLGLKRTYVDPVAGEEREDRRGSLVDRRSRGIHDFEPPGGPVESRGQDRRTDWRTDYNIVVLKVGPNRFGIIVDELHDTEEIVVKPLSSFIDQCNCFSGATLLGDGRVIMILDANGIAERAGLHFADVQAEEKRRLEEEKRREAMVASQRRAIVLCEAAAGEYFAIGQDRVLRLEKIASSSIERMADREYVEYRGKGLPLLRLDRFLPVRPLPEEDRELYMVIPKASGNADRGAAVGILISNIVDAVNVEVQLEKESVEGPGVLGTALVQDRLTLFIEPDALVAAAGLAGGAV